MRRSRFAILLAAAALALAALPGGARAQCPGTSGTATIDGVGWTADCVIAVTATDCVDSLGGLYECFEILGSSASNPSYASVALFFGETPVQGQTYDLGGSSPNAGMVVGEATFAITADTPYTGQVTLNVFNSGAGTFECTFHFEARSIFFGPDLSVTNGHFSGTLVGVEPSTWTDVKAIYR